MKTKMKFLLYAIMAFAIVFTSCDGEDGSNGIDGAIGLQGPAGTAGQDGNANVVSVLLENQTIKKGQNIFEIPELTQEIADSGLVYVYGRGANPDDLAWVPLPNFDNGVLQGYIEKIDVGKVFLQATNADTGVSLRFVLVEGTIKSSIDFSNFEAVKAYYNL